MTALSRLTLTAPFVLIIVEYCNHAYDIYNNPALQPFWKNHGLRESLFAIVLSGVVLNYIWSNDAPQKMKMIGLFGAPLVLAYWVFGSIVGFDPYDETRGLYLLHLAETIIFIVGYLMVLSSQSAKK